jgi:nicotinamide-nucleotide amidase
MATVDKFLIAKGRKAIKRLKAAGLTVVTAESCTAGLVAALLSRGEGASDILHGGFVTYTKDQKYKALGVPKTVLKNEGSVTAQVAKAMAMGALRKSSADIALAVTGVLGPTCDQDGNAVGLVYLACARKGKAIKTVKLEYGRRSNDQLRRKVVVDALDLLSACAR